MTSARRQRQRKIGMSWGQIDRATLDADRAEFRRTRPGERVEAMLELIGELAPLAARGRARTRRDG